MSCYLRHLQEAMQGAGIEVTKENRRQVDMAVHRAVGLDHKHCPSAWKEVKRRMAEDREAFLADVKREMARG